MSRYTPDGKTSLWWVTSISSKTAPTAAEIAAGVNMTSYLAAEGFDPGPATNKVDSAGLDDTFDAKRIGTFGNDVKVTLFRDDSADTAYTTLAYKTAGFWVLREHVTSTTAIAAGQKVDVYPAELGQPMKSALSKNTTQKFTSEAAITSAPAFNATVA